MKIFPAIDIKEKKCVRLLKGDFNKQTEFQSFKEKCNKTGTTEEALANAEKVGFKTNFFV